jgi:hypothetical protein
VARGRQNIGAERLNKLGVRTGSSCGNLGFINTERVETSMGEETYDKICRNRFLSASGDVTIFDVEVVDVIVKNQVHTTVEVLLGDAFPPVLWISVVQDELSAMNDGYILFLFYCQ